MKKLVLAATAAFALSATAVAASDYGVWSTAEYAIEAETFEVETGVDVSYNNFTFTPAFTLGDVTGDFDFVSAEVTASYKVNSNFSAYATVETDSDFDYAETTVGVRVDF